MAVRVVPDASLTKPDRLPDAEVVAKDAFVVLAAEPRIAHLHVGEEPLLGHEQQALTVGFDAAALEDHAFAVVRTDRLDARNPGDACHGFANPRVAGIVVVLRPRVEAPVHERDRAVVTNDRRRGGVTEPDAIVRHEVQSVACWRDTVRVENGACVVTHRLVVAENLHTLVRGEHAHDLAVHPRDRRELARPVGLVVRPRDPRRVVALPLCREAKRSSVRLLPTGWAHPRYRLRIGP